MLEYIKNRKDDYDVGMFVNELVAASKNLGIVEAQIMTYRFNSFLVPMLQMKEAVSSMDIEGVQTTVSDVLKGNIEQTSSNEKKLVEAKNHLNALVFGAEILRTEEFTHTLIRHIHKIMMNGIIQEELNDTLGCYKRSDNKIKNSKGKVVYNPPSVSETKKYMDELLVFMNDHNDDIHPLIKAAMIHSQFESIHPFSDGNGRVGRVLISLYLYKTQVFSFPFFYMSEAISMDKPMYYRMLTDSRENSLDGWIGYFLRKISVQANRMSEYMESLNRIYERTKVKVRESIKSPKYEDIIECIFAKPVLDAKNLEEKLLVSHAQAVRYLNALEKAKVLTSDDRQRGKTYFFDDLLDLANGTLI